MTPRLPPNAPEAESGLLGAILLDPGAAQDALGRITADHFFDLAHQTLFQCLQGMIAQNARIDLVTVSNQLRHIGQLDSLGGVPWLSTLMDGVPSASNAAYYAEILTEKRHLRQLIEAATATIEEVHGSGELPLKLVQNAHTRFEAIAADAEDSGDIMSDHGVELARSTLTDAEELCRNQGKLPGITYGLDGLDAITGGMLRGEVVVVGARPSVGKTAFAVSVARVAAWEHRIPTLFITLESPVRALMRRMIANQCSIPLTRYKAGEFLQSDFAKIATATAQLKEIPLYFVGKGRNGRTVEDVRSIIRYHVRKFGVQLVLIDYLTKIKTGGGGKFRREKLTYEIGDITDALHTEAERSNVALVELAQLKRDAELRPNRKKRDKFNRDDELEDSVPSVADLGDSKAIEQDADTVILLHRDRTIPAGPAIAMVAKQRDGECKVCRLLYQGHFTRFTNLVKTPPPSKIPDDVLTGFPT